MAKCKLVFALTVFRMDFFGAGHGWGRGGRGRKIAKMAILGFLKITVF